MKRAMIPVPDQANRGSAGFAAIDAAHEAHLGRTVADHRPGVWVLVEAGVGRDRRIYACRPGVFAEAGIDRRRAAVEARRPALPPVMRPASCGGAVTPGSSAIEPAPPVPVFMASPASPMSPTLLMSPMSPLHATKLAMHSVAATRPTQIARRNAVPVHRDMGARPQDPSAGTTQAALLAARRHQVHECERLWPHDGGDLRQLAAGLGVERGHGAVAAGEVETRRRCRCRWWPRARAPRCRACRRRTPRSRRRRLQSSPARSQLPRVAAASDGCTRSAGSSARGR